MVDVVKMFGELSPHIENYIENKKKRMETGFNLFYLISDYYYRETFHSDIIAALLDPCEKHGKNNCYTNLFIDMINQISKNPINKDFYTTPKVAKEFPTDDGNMRGRVDIFIEGDIPDKKGKRHCIVIENKLNNASDTEQQLPKYSRDLENRGFDIDAFVYMPLDPNKKPSKSDWGNKREDIDNKLVIIPAYNPGVVNLIDNWLKPALDKSEGDASFVIQQYIRVLNNLTIDIMDNKGIIEVLSKDENFETTVAVLENKEAFCNIITDDFILDLGNKAKDLGYRYSFKGNSRIEINNGRWTFVIEKYYRNGQYWRGIEVDPKENINPDKENFFGGNSKCDISYPIGWNYYEGERGYWSSLKTIREMRDGSFADYIIEEVKSAFERMNELYE